MTAIPDFHEFLEQLRDIHEERWNTLEEEYKTNDKKFIITGFELKSLDEWTAEHGKVCQKRAYSYSFSQTSGIGTGVTVECKCGAYQDITDYESW